MNKYLIAQNLDLLLIVLDSLFVACMNKGDFNSNMSWIPIELHQVRINNPFRKLKIEQELTSADIYQCISILDSLLKELAIQKVIVDLLKEYILVRKHNVKSNYVLKYQKRFEFFFYKYMDEYKIGKMLYKQSYINHLSIFYLYILYLISIGQGFYYLSYCLNHIRYYDLYRTIADEFTLPPFSG